MTDAAVIKLCNGALFKLGDTYIDNNADLSTPSNNVERVCANQFELSVKSVLRLHGWNCASKRGELAQDESVSPVIEFKKAYSLPTDYVRLTTIWLNGYKALEDYRNEGGYILTDATGVHIKYVYFPGWEDDSIGTFLNRLDPDVLKLMQIQLAIDIAPSIQGVTVDKERLLDEFQLLLEEAKISDASDDQPKRLYSNIMFHARMR